MTPTMVEILSIFVFSGLTLIVAWGLAYFCGYLCSLYCKGAAPEAVLEAERRSTIDTGVDSESDAASVIASAQHVQNCEVRVINEVQPQRQARPRSQVASNVSDQRATFYAAAATSSSESLCFTGDRKRLSLELENLTEKIEQLKLKKAQLNMVRGRWDQEVFV